MEGNFDLDDHLRQQEKLERERDEALEALSGRTVSCLQCNEAAKQLEAMRSAIKEAHDEMHEIMMAPWANLPGRANDMIEAVVNKLQPFLQ